MKDKTAQKKLVKMASEKSRKSSGGSKKCDVGSKKSDLRSKKSGPGSKKSGGGLGECLKGMFSCFLTYASPHSAPFDDDNPEDLNLHPHKSSLPTQSQKCPTRTEDQAREKNNGAMLSFHNSTLHCEGCRGESYWVSFHERSFFRGRRFKLYRGIINGKGPYVGDRCVVKVFANQYGTENHCCQEVLKSEQLRKLIHAFNQRLNQNQIKKPHRLRATRSYWAPIDEVSKLKSLFFSGHKNLSVGEGVVFEQDLRVSEYSTKKCKYVTEFVDQSGIWFDGNYSQIINAFIHFTYDYTGGNLVVCGLNGVKDESGYFLSTPTIHTKTLEFGQTDGGLRGIHDVMKNHTCGHLCQELSIDRRPSMPHSLHIGIEVKTSMSEPIPAPSIVPDDNTDSWSQQQHFSTDPQIFYSPSSHASVFTENNTPFSEPSAPEMEDIGDVIIPPPPYSRAQEARVAYWIIGEESGNRFLHNSPSLPVPCGSARLGSSVECQSAHNTCNSLGSKDLGSSVPSTTHTHESESTSPNNTAHIPPSPTQCQDINANFMCHNNPGTEPRSDIISVSELSTHHPEPGMVTEEIKIESKTVGDPAVDRNKRVRFEDPAAPNYQKTPTAPSVFTGLSDDVTMDTWTSASISSSPSMAVRSQFQHYRQRQDSMCTDSSAHAPSVAGTDVCPRELPPPYTLHDPTQSQLTTAYWLLRRNGYEMHSFRPPVFAPWEVRVTTANNNNNNTSNNNNNSNNNEDNNNNNNDFNYLAWIKK